MKATYGGTSRLDEAAVPQLLMGGRVFIAPFVRLLTCFHSCRIICYCHCTEKRCFTLIRKCNFSSNYNCRHA